MAAEAGGFETTCRHHRRAPVLEGSNNYLLKKTCEQHVEIARGRVLAGQKEAHYLEPEVRDRRVSRFHPQCD